MRESYSGPIPLVEFHGSQTGKKKDCRNQQKIKSNIPLDKKWTVNSIRDHHERVLLKEVDTYRLWLFD